MDALENIMTRRSVRRFTDAPVSDADLRTILEAGMKSPSAVNARDWAFIAIRDRKTLDKMADANGRAAQPLKNAALGILVCGDMNRAFAKAKEYWVINASIVCENMILAAHALGIGSVWLGTWPQEEKVQGQKELFGLPDEIVPHSVIAFGYPDEEGSIRGFYEEDRVHYEKW